MLSHQSRFVFATVTINKSLNEHLWQAIVTSRLFDEPSDILPPINVLSHANIS